MQLALHSLQPRALRWLICPPPPISGSGWRCIIYKEYIRDDKGVTKVGGEVNKIPTPCIHFVLCFLLSFFSVGPHPKSGPYLIVVKVSGLHTIRRTTSGMTPLNEGLAHRRRHYLHSTQQTKDELPYSRRDTDPLNPKNEKAADVRIRPCGQRLRPS